MPENYLVFGLIENWIDILINSNGETLSINVDGIRFVLEIEDIPIQYKKEIAQKIIISLQASIQSIRTN